MVELAAQPLKAEILFHMTCQGTVFSVQNQPALQNHDFWILPVILLQSLANILCASQ